MSKLMKSMLIAVVAMVLLIGVLYYWFPGLILESVKHGPLLGRARKASSAGG